MFTRRDGHLRNRGKHLILFAVQAYNELRRISFAVGPLFLVSSVLFGMGSIAKEFPGYFTSQWFPDWIDHAVNFPYLVRSTLAPVRPSNACTFLSARLLTLRAWCMASGHASRAAGQLKGEM